MVAIDIVINLIASLIALTIGLFWKEKFIPWMRVFLYKGIQIHGKWRIEQPEKTVDGGIMNVTREIYVDVVQHADLLTGTATSVATYHDGNRDFIVYDIRGEIKDRFVTVNFKVNDNTRIAYSSFLLEIVADGQIMIGYRVFYGFKKRAIRSIACKWFRVTNTLQLTNRLPIIPNSPPNN